MFLFSIIEILCIATVFSSNDIPLTTEKPNSLQQDTLKKDVHDIRGLFESSVNSSRPILKERPIALEGGSSVLANDTVISKSINQKGLDQNTTWEQTTSYNGTGIHSNNLHQAIQTEGGVLDIPLNLGDVSDHPSVVPRKGAPSKIVPRKGAEPYEAFPEPDDNTEVKSACNCCETHSLEQNIENYTADPRCISCCNTSDSKIPVISVTALKNYTTDFQSASNSSNSSDVNIADSNVNVTDIKSETTLNESNGSDVYRASPPLKKKFKPLVTSDTDSEQKQQKIPQSSSTERSDFIIPVVVLILAVPVVIVLAMLFYRKGTEFWERRHYSKMDFLIDGMYNE